MLRVVAICVVALGCHLIVVADSDIKDNHPKAESFVKLFTTVQSDVEPTTQAIEEDQKDDYPKTEHFVDLFTTVQTDVVPIMQNIENQKDVLNDDYLKSETSVEKLIPKSPELKSRAVDVEVEYEEETFCSRPPDIDGVISPILESDNFPEKSVISYRCKFGYVSSSSSSLQATCRIDKRSGKAEWILPNITCIPQSCGDPGYVVNGRRIGNLFTFPNNVKFECLEGYKIQGLKERYCQVNGEWSGELPTCIPIRCPIPSNPKNGRVLYSSLDYGTELQYQCDKGFMLRKYEPRICEEDGVWSNEEPECIEVSCRIPEAPEHGSVQLYDELPKVGSLVFYSCNEGTTLVGATTAKCLKTGDWTFDPPKCLRSCYVPEIYNGELGRVERKTRYREQFISFRVGESVKHLETVTLRCNAGYSTRNNTYSTSQEVRCNGGTWTEPLSCYSMECNGEAPPVEHASPQIPSRMHGQVIWYKCDDGYKKSKGGAVVCKYGKWEGPTPACSDYRCYMEELNYPGLLKPERNFIHDGQHFKLFCDKAYTVSTWKKHVSCSDGKWDLTKNPCKIKECEDEPPRLNNGKPREFTRVNGSVVDYECEEGYELEGHSSVHCAFGVWEGIPPMCKHSKENITENIENKSEYDDVTPNSLKSSISSSEPEECFCTYDYRTDLLEAHWNNRRIQSHDRIRKGEKVIFKCLHPGMDIAWPNGLRFYEKMEMLCDRCLDWQMYQLPRCEIRGSGDSFIASENPFKLLPGGIIEVPKFSRISIICGNIWLRPRWEVMPSRRVNFEDFPYPVGEPSYLRQDIIINKMDYEHEGRYECVAWHNRARLRPSVIDLKIVETDVLCPDLSRETNRGSFKITYSNERRVYSKARYDCKDPLKKIVGPNERECLEDGKWTDVFPACEDIRCPPLNENSEFMITYINNRNVNSFAVYSCKNINQRLIGSSNRTCLHAGKWSGTNPVCEDITCPDFQRYNGLSVTYSRGTKVDSIASFKCLNHATLVGSPEARCLHNGSWSHPRPSCELLEIHCPKIDGKDIFTIQYSNSRKVNSTALFFCKAPDKKVAGCNFMICQQNGEWSGDYPTCVDFVTCDSFPTSPNLKVRYSDGDRVGSVASFRCVPPTSLVGNNSAKCLPEGAWSHSLPTCIAPNCSISDAEITLPENLHLNQINITSEFVTPGTEIPLICEDHLVHTGSSKILCNFQGKWDSIDAECISACRVRKEETSNLIFEPKKDYYRFGESILLSCPPGQKLTSEVERMVCLGQTWSDPLPDCSEMTESNQSGFTQTVMKSR